MGQIPFAFSSVLQCLSGDVASQTREISIKTSRTKDLSAVMYRLGVCNIGALRNFIIRIGFGGFLSIIMIIIPLNPIVNISGPRLCESLDGRI